MAAKPWMFDWRGASYLDFIEWIQEADILVKFSRAVNERIHAMSGWNNSYIKKTEAFSLILDGLGNPIGKTFNPQPSTPEANAFYTGYSLDGYQEDPARFKSIPHPLPVYPEPVNGWYNSVLLSTERGGATVDVAQSPISLLMQLALTTYQSLPLLFMATHNADGTPITTTDPNQLTDPTAPKSWLISPWLNEYNYATADGDDPSWFPYYKSIWGHFTVRDAFNVVTQYNYPKPGGPDAYYPREINDINAPGVAGQIARIVYAALDNKYTPSGTAPGTATTLARDNSGRICFHDGTVWTIGTEADAINFNPDVVHEQRFPKRGDYVGAWILADMRDTLNMCRFSLSTITNETDTEHSPRIDEAPRAATVAVANYVMQDRTGDSLDYTGDDLESVTWITDPDFFDTIDYDTFSTETDLPLAVVAGTVATQTAATDDYNASPLVTYDEWSGNIFDVLSGIYYSIDSLSAFELLSGDTPGASVYKSRMRYAVSTDPWLQAKGVGRKIKLFAESDRRSLYTVKSPEFYRQANGFPSPPNSNVYKFNYYDSPVSYTDGDYQPFLQLVSSLEGSDSVLFTNYIGDMNAPTNWPQYWEVWSNGDIGNSNDGFVSYGASVNLHSAIIEWAFDGGFRYSHASDAAL